MSNAFSKLFVEKYTAQMEDGTSGHLNISVLIKFFLNFE